MADLYNYSAFANGKVPSVSSVSFVDSLVAC